MTDPFKAEVQKMIVDKMPEIIEALAREVINPKGKKRDRLKALELLLRAASLDHSVGRKARKHLAELSKK